MIAGPKPYPEMKDSGVAWLSEVPRHWGIRRLRAVAHIKTGGRDTIDRCDDGDYPFFVRSPNVEKIDTWSFDGEAVLTAGDGHVGRIFHYVNGKFDFHQRVYKFSDFRNVLGRYFFHYFGSTFRHEALQGTAKSTVESLRLPMLQNFPVVLPTLPEQAAIARFLDHADRRIQRYVLAKEKLIALLDEHKQALIRDAVTGRIDVRTGRPYPVYKDSGVGWLGLIPGHWHTERVRFLLREVDTRSTTGEEPPLSMSQALGLVPSHMVERSLGAESQVGAKLCERDDLVLNRLKAHLGVFALARQEGLVSPDYSVFRKRGLACMEYFERVLRLPALRPELRMRSKGIVEGFWRLYTHDLFDIRVPIPPVAEQENVVAYVSGAMLQGQRVIAQTRKMLVVMGEYRVRLIADVVTGKLDVREAAAKLPDIDALAGDEDESVAPHEHARANLDEAVAVP